MCPFQNACRDGVDHPYTTEKDEKKLLDAMSRLTDADWAPPRGIKVLTNIGLWVGSGKWDKSGMRVTPEVSLFRRSPCRIHETENDRNLFLRFSRPELKIAR